MKDLIDKKVYVEVYEVIQHEEEFKRMLPKHIFDEIKQKAGNTGYSFPYDEKKNMIEQISRDALSFCISLYLQYGANETEKDKFKEVLIRNEVEYKNQPKDILSISEQEKIMQMVEEKVRQELDDFMSQDIVGYQYFFELRKKELLESYGIQWEPSTNQKDGVMIN